MPYSLVDVRVHLPLPSTAVQLLLSDPAYTDRLAAYLESLGQTAIIDAPGRLELEQQPDEGELAIYLRVWHVLYPEAVVEVVRDKPPPDAA
jgi:hypothetical protein